MTTATAVKERPILFSGDMVKSILDGRKTQTRRIVKPQPHEGAGEISVESFCPIVIRRGEEEAGEEIFGAYDEDGEWGAKCPYGQPGERLWVREAHYVESAGYQDGTDKFILYKATDEGAPVSKWTPSIHMPRWASRITLEITEVRVERLQSISQEDAKAEGMEPGCHTCGENCIYTGGCGCCLPDYRDSLAYTWMKCYGDDSWHANPWVWAISFRRA